MLWVCLLGILNHHHFSKMQKNRQSLQISMLCHSSQNFNVWHRMNRDDEFRRHYARATQMQSICCCLDPRKLGSGEGFLSFCNVCHVAKPGQWLVWYCGYFYHQPRRHDKSLSSLLAQISKCKMEMIFVSLISNKVIRFQYLPGRVSQLSVTDHFMRLLTMMSKPVLMT